MDDDEDDKCCYGDREKPVIPPGDQRTRDEHDESPSAQRVETALVLFCRKFSFLKPLLVFGPQISV